VESEATRWQKRENDMFARLEGLLVASQETRLKDPVGREASSGGELVGLGARAKTRKTEEVVAGSRDTSTPQSITMTSRLEPGAFVNPVVHGIPLRIRSCRIRGGRETGIGEASSGSRESGRKASR
jgi:hypothetical protein